MLDCYDVLIYLQYRGLRQLDTIWDYSTSYVGGFRISIRCKFAPGYKAALEYTVGTFILLIDPEGDDVKVIHYDIRVIGDWLERYGFLNTRSAATGSWFDTPGHTPVEDLRR